MKTAANIEAVRKLCERWAWLSEKEFALRYVREIIPGCFCTRMFVPERSAETG